MAYCGPECEPADIPVIVGSACNITTRPSGIDRIVFAKCTLDPDADLTSLVTWQGLIDDATIGYTGHVLGSKPLGTQNSVRLASCYPEAPTSGTNTVTWTDNNADLTGLTEYDFYIFVMQNYGRLLFGYVTCDDLFFGFISRWTILAGDVRTDNSDDAASFQATVTYNSLVPIKPISVPGLGALLNSIAS